MCIGGPVGRFTENLQEGDLRAEQKEKALSFFFLLHTLILFEFIAMLLYYLMRKPLNIILLLTLTLDNLDKLLFVCMSHSNKV